MEFVGNRCCQCSHSTHRCSSDECTCYANGKKCNSNCESSKWSSDCLNRTIIRCYCLSKCVGGISAPILNSVNTGTTHNHHSSSKSKEKNAADFQSSCNALNCDCFKFHEKCSLECSCKGECTNNIQKFSLTPVERPYISCKCGSGKKSCLKNDKCPCKKLFQHCSPMCKCKTDCCNGKFDSDLSKSTKLCFVSPDQDTSAIVVRLTATEVHHNFQMEFTNEKNLGKHVEEMFYDNFVSVLSHYTIPLRRVVVYLSKSSCFHQDCEPKCEVLNECADNKACAKVLSTLYRQIQTYLTDTSIQMTVKFLLPYVKRGDLFTKQGILAMMEAGIDVEPIGVKEWGDLLKDKSELADPTTYAQCYSMWTTCGMDNYVRQSQQYINDGRRTLGMKESYWSSGVHEILKVSLEATHKTQKYYDEIARRLSKLDEKSPASKPTSRDATLIGSVPNAFTLQKTSAGDKKSKKKYVSRSNTGPTLLTTKNGQQAKLTISQSNHDDMTFGVTSPNEENNFLSDSIANLNVNDVDAHATSICNVNVDRLLMALSNRNITEEERIEIQNELTTGVENLKLQLNQFMELLERRITTTSL